MIIQTKRRRRGVKRYRTAITYEDLKRIESSETPRTDTPKALSRSAIKIADQVFQWRPADEDNRADQTASGCYKNAGTLGAGTCFLDML